MMEDFAKEFNDAQEYKDNLISKLQDKNAMMREALEYIGKWTYEDKIRKVVAKTLTKLNKTPSQNT